MHDPNYEQLAAELDEARLITRAELERRAALLNPYLRDPTMTSAGNFLRFLICRSLNAQSLDDALTPDDIKNNLTSKTLNEMARGTAT
jgi:hypothetical protein